MERKAFLYTFAFIYNFTNPGEMNKQTKILQVDKQDLKKKKIYFYNKGCSLAKCTLER